MPIRETGLLHDPSCAGDPLYRTVQVGQRRRAVHARRAVLPQRRASTAASVAATSVRRCRRPVRTTFPFSLFLSPTPPPGCLAAINNPTRTMLGPVQKAQLKNDLLNSTATVQDHRQRGPDPAVLRTAVRPLGGLRAERSEILNFIRNNGIDNVAVPDDGHPRARSRTRCSSTGSRDPPRSPNEMVTGPIATTTFQNEVIGSGRTRRAVRGATRRSTWTGIDCRHLDQNSYATVERERPPAARRRSRPRTTPAPVIRDQNVAVTFCTGTYGP